MTTTDEIARLLPEARAEAEKNSALAMGHRDPWMLTSNVTDMVMALVCALANPTVEWAKVRTLALRAVWLLLVVAWEAGRRCVAFIGRDMGGIDLGRDANGNVRPMVMSADEIKIGGQTSPRQTPPPTNVDDLLREAEALVGGTSHTWIGAQKTILDLVAALRAEQARADKVGAEAKRHFEQACKNGAAGWELSAKHNAAVGHLHAVLAHFSPDPTRGPTVAQKAHVFLSGATIHPLAQDEAEANLRAELAKEREVHAQTKAERDRTREDLRRALAACVESESALKQEQFKHGLLREVATRESERRDKRERELCQSLDGWESSNRRAMFELGAKGGELLVDAAKRVCGELKQANATMLDALGVSAGLREKLAAARDEAAQLESALVHVAKMLPAKGVA